MSPLKRAWAVLYWLPTVVLLTDFYTLKLVSGRSMQVRSFDFHIFPTLNPDSSVLWRDVAIFEGRLLTHRLEHSKRGDIVAFKSPVNPKRQLVKRIMAIEGDTVRTLPPYPEPEISVPQGHVWLEGDAFHSQDSNTFGPVPLGLVDSRLVYLVWPFWRFGFSTGPAHPNPHPRVTPRALG